MRIMILLLCAMVAGGCVNQPHGDDIQAASGVVELAPIGGRYDDARERLLNNGWRALPVECGERVICFEHPELATYLDKEESCGAFRKATRTLKICITSVVDDAFIESVDETKEG